MVNNRNDDDDDIDGNDDDGGKNIKERYILAIIKALSFYRYTLLMIDIVMGWHFMHNLILYCFYWILWKNQININK